MIAHKSITLLGSAPGADLSGHHEELLACVNASALILPPDIIPDIIFLNTGVAAAREAGAASRPRLGQLRTRVLVIIESGTPLDQALPVFAGIRRESELHITLEQRSAFLHDFFQQPLGGEYGGDHVPSTGMVACLLLLASGARNVDMRGFSFGDGHSYLAQVFKRGHVDKDREALRILAQRGLPVGLPPAWQQNDTHGDAAQPGLTTRWFGRFRITPALQGVHCRDCLLPGGKDVPASRYRHLTGRQREQAFFQYGLVPGSISAFEGAIAQRSTDDMLFWQFPCRTEAAAWALHAPLAEAVRTGDTLHMYVGLPWANWIDCERKQAWNAAGLVARQTQLQVAGVRISGWKHALAELGMALRVHTVCQHVEWRDLCKTWQETGITDVWLAHLPHDQAQRADLSPSRLGFHPHPWALYAVNVEDAQRNSGIGIGRAPQEKTVLASFVGAYGAGYVSPSRELLRQLAHEPDCVIRITDKWHFEDVVYRHQMAGADLAQSYAIDETVLEYNRLLSDSVFSLCPAGTGPNSLRLWESLAVGAIPVLLGPRPMLPRGGTLAPIDWDGIVLYCADADIGQLAQRLRAIPPHERQARQRRALAAYALVREQRCF